MASSADPACQGVVLVADSSPDIGDICRNYLEPEGFRVLFTKKDRHKTDAIRRILPDILLLDMTTPVGDGFQTIELLKADPATRGISIIVLAVRNGDGTAEKALGKGADEFLKKPFDGDELVARVNKTISAQKSRQGFLTVSEELIRSQTNIITALQAWEQEAREFKQQVEAIVTSILSEAGGSCGGDETMTRSERARELINRIAELNLFKKPEKYMLH